MTNVTNCSQENFALVSIINSIKCFQVALPALKDVGTHKSHKINLILILEKQYQVLIHILGSFILDFSLPVWAPLVYFLLDFYTGYFWTHVE